MDKKEFQRKCMRYGYGTHDQVRAWLANNPKPFYTESDLDECGKYCAMVEWGNYRDETAEETEEWN